MRAILLVVIIAIVAIIAAVASGFVDIDQVRGAKAPDVAASQNGVTAQGGQAPAFEVETGSVKVGSSQTNIQVPTLEVRPPQNEAAAATNNGM